MNKRMKKLVAIGLALGLMGSIMTGCGSGNDSVSDGKGKNMKIEGEKEKSDKIFTTIVNIQPPPAFNGNPYDTAGLDWSVQPLMFDYLADFSAFPERTFKESLLESYKLDGKVLTMKLKNSLKWSDGSPLTAEDVLTNYQVNIGKSAVWNYAEKIEKIDELTIKITYAVESPLLLNIAFSLPIMSPTKVYGKWAKQYGEIAKTERVFNKQTKAYEFTKKGQEKLTNINNDLLAFKPAPKEVLCSGPYIIENVTTAEVLFVKNKNYRIDSEFEKVRGLRPGSPEAFATSVLEKQYTLENGGLSPDMAKQVDEKYKDTMRKTYIPELSQMGFAFNTSKYPVNIPEVRKAISLAADRETLISIAEPGSFLSDTKNTGLVPSMIKNYANEDFVKGLTDYRHNEDEAKNLLESIGWKKNDAEKWIDDKGEVVKLEIATINSWPTFMLTSEALSTMLQEFGFEVQFKPMEGGNIWNYLSSEDAMIGSTFLGASGSYAHPWEAYNNIFTSTRLGFEPLNPGEDRIIKNTVDEKEYNVTQMLRELFQETDEIKIKEKTQEFMKLMNDMCIFMPVVEKASTLRVYDEELSLAEGTTGEIQNSFYYFGTINLNLAKMLRAGEINFTEKK